MSSRTRLKRKELDDVLGGEEAWKDADSTSGTPSVYSTKRIRELIEGIVAPCEKCGNDRAYFMQMQIRSADEPMTTCAFSLFINDRPSDLAVHPQSTGWQAA